MNGLKIYHDSVATFDCGHWRASTEHSVTEMHIKANAHVQTGNNRQGLCTDSISEPMQETKFRLS